MKPRTELPVSGGVYVIRHLPSCRVYVGQTHNFQQRIKGHIGLLRKGTHHCRALQLLWVLGKEEDFEFEIISEEEKPKRRLRLEYLLLVTCSRSGAALNKSEPIHQAFMPKNGPKRTLHDTDVIVSRPYVTSCLVLFR
jgi:predicted GIY-YIG superfamily endonuclease